MKMYRPMDFKEMVEKEGLNKITVKQLNGIIEQQGIEVLNFANFNEIYKLVSQRESSRKMNGLTWWIGGMTLITTICTIFSAFK